MFRQDRNCFGGGLCIYVKENIVPKQLSLHLDKETEAIYLEINVPLRKWLIVGLYKPPSQNNSLFLENMSKNLSRYLDSYENITLLGDFNMTREDKNLQHFTDTFNLEHLINEPTNYRPVSLLSHDSKVYERIVFNQTSTFFESYFSSLLTGFCKNHNTNHSLLKM